MDSKSSAIHDHHEMPECLKGTVTHVISDNAANMTKAFNLPGFKSSDPDPRENDIALDSESDVELEEEENELFSYFAQLYGCFAHTVNLIVKV